MKVTRLVALERPSRPSPIDDARRGRHRSHFFIVTVVPLPTVESI
jgi:hypothetical protein